MNESALEKEATSHLFIRIGFSSEEFQGAWLWNCLPKILFAWILDIVNMFLVFFISH